MELNEALRWEMIDMQVILLRIAERRLPDVVDRPQDGGARGRGPKVENGDVPR